MAFLKTGLADYRMGSGKKIIVLRLVLAGLSALLAAPTASAAPSEAAVKAALIANFALYVEWPDSTLQTGRTRICTVGSGSTVNALLDLDSRTLFGRVIHVLQITRLSEIHACQILFLGNTSQRQPEEWLMEATDLPVLTVSEAENFVLHGGIVGLDRADNRVVFDVSLKAMRRGGLRINAALLRLARKVYPN